MPHACDRVMCSVMVWMRCHMCLVSLEQVKWFLTFLAYSHIASWMSQKWLVLTTLSISSSFALKAAFHVISSLCTSAVNHGFWFAFIGFDDGDISNAFVDELHH